MCKVSPLSPALFFTESSEQNSGKLLWWHRRGRNHLPRRTFALLKKHPRRLVGRTLAQAWPHLGLKLAASGLRRASTWAARGPSWGVKRSSGALVRLKIGLLASNPFQTRIGCDDLSPHGLPSTMMSFFQLSGMAFYFACSVDCDLLSHCFSHIQVTDPHRLSSTQS